MLKLNKSPRSIITTFRQHFTVKISKTLSKKIIFCSFCGALFARPQTLTSYVVPNYVINLTVYVGHGSQFSSSLYGKKYIFISLADKVKDLPYNMK